MATNECIPFHKPGDQVTHTVVGANVTGKTLGAIPTTPITGGMVGYNNPLIQTCGAGLRADGVIMWDAIVGATVGLIAEGIVPITVGATAVTAGDPLKSDAAGKVVPQAGSGVIIGYAKDSAIVGADVPVRLVLN